MTTQIHPCIYNPRTITPFWVGEYDGEFVCEDATGTSEHDAIFHATREAAQSEVDEMNRQFGAWNRQPAADAPHADNY